MPRALAISAHLDDIEFSGAGTGGGAGRRGVGCALAALRAHASQLGDWDVGGSLPSGCGPLANPMDSPTPGPSASLPSDAESGCERASLRDVCRYTRCA
ncbi:MAG: hypothetical protein M3144_02205, partial [Actinomycetota bacterium]|nr:hypothetical protein [Actinomycetota bacterium]